MSCLLAGLTRHRKQRGDQVVIKKEIDVRVIGGLMLVDRYELAFTI